MCEPSLKLVPSPDLYFYVVDVVDDDDDGDWDLHN